MKVRRYGAYGTDKTRDTHDMKPGPVPIDLRPCASETFLQRLREAHSLRGDFRPTVGGSRLIEETFRGPSRVTSKTLRIGLYEMQDIAQRT